MIQSFPFIVLAYICNLATAPVENLLTAYQWKRGLGYHSDFSLFSDFTFSHLFYQTTFLKPHLSSFQFTENVLISEIGEKGAKPELNIEDRLN